MASWEYEKFLFAWSDEVNDFVFWPQGKPSENSNDMVMKDILDIYGIDRWEILSITPLEWATSSRVGRGAQMTRVTKLLATVKRDADYTGPR